MAAFRPKTLLDAAAERVARACGRKGRLEVNRGLFGEIPRILYYEVRRYVPSAGRQWVESNLDSLRMVERLGADHYLVMVDKVRKAMILQVFLEHAEEEQEEYEYKIWAARH